MLMCQECGAELVRVLEAEAKFKSLYCHRCELALSVVMATPTMREGSAAGPEGQARPL